MTRLVLLIILGFVAALYFPESRAVIADAAEPVLTPLFRWQTKHEMGEIAREIQVFERENYGRIPSNRGFPGWLDRRFSEDVKTDSWNGPYSITYDRDSFYVASWGPDGLPRTADDLRVGRARSVPGR